MGTVEERIQREREFHNALATEPLSWRVLHALSGIFYNKGQDGILWAPVWREIELRNRKVLDYGCGPGDFSAILAERGAIVSGIDVSEYQVSVAKNSVHSDVHPPEFAVGDAHHTGFPDASFDYVFGNGILHHLDLLKAYAEIWRVLKPGGRAYFMEPLADHPVVKIVRKITPSARTDDERPMRLYDIRLAESVGFSIRQRVHYLVSPAVLPTILFGKTVAKTLLRKLDYVDQTLFRAFPRLSEFAWLAMIELSRPLPDRENP